MKLARAGYIASVFGCLLLPGILNAGIVPQEMASIYEDFRLDKMTFGIIAGSVSIAATCLGVSAAWLVPRWGAYRTCLAGYGLLVLGLIGTSQAGFGPLALGLGVCLAWGMAYLHLANGLAVQLAPHRAAAMTNLLHGINGIGKAVGPLFALLGTGWRPPFLALGLLAAALGALGLVGLRAPPEPSSEGSTGRNEEAPAREALRAPLFWACAALFFPIVGMEICVTIWLPNHLQHDAGLEKAAGEAAAQTAALTILWTMCALRLLAPLYLRALPPVAWLALSACAAPGILLVTEGGHAAGPWAFAGFVLCGIAFAAPWPTFFALACRYFPKHKGLLSIGSGAATSLAYIVFYALGGVVGAKAGLEWTLRISPMLAALMGLGAVLIWWRGERGLR
ncbi:MAG: MFS transporter [Planctomycetota bacterium]|nr:MFS transporter [Planctomycetota bacterium]